VTIRVLVPVKEPSAVLARLPDRVEPRRELGRLSASTITYR